MEEKVIQMKRNLDKAHYEILKRKRIRESETRNNNTQTNMNDEHMKRLLISKKTKQIDEEIPNERMKPKKERESSKSRGDQSAG